MSRKILSKYFSEEIIPQERDSVIDRVLEEWFERNPESKVILINKRKEIVR